MNLIKANFTDIMKGNIMFLRKMVISILAIAMIMTTSGMAFARENYGQQYQQQQTSGQKAKRVLEYGAFGAGAGYVLSGKHNRGTNIIKGAAIGTAAGLLTGK